ncbi:hypothetical protein EVAR_34594_1 [Eumeta japonica]|uniref:Uncharacterized protein n=1 Tax=Eumeta variegata TaxID=151549 RepID=A0A4C1VG02_EUMVA|nr:hypothetical protein EVAR_34594_1 [Eumeta japonica]
MCPQCLHPVSPPSQRQNMSGFSKGGMSTASKARMGKLYLFTSHNTRPPTEPRQHRQDQGRGADCRSNVIIVPTAPMTATASPEQQPSPSTAALEFPLNVIEPLTQRNILPNFTILSAQQPTAPIDPPLKSITIEPVADKKQRKRRTKRRRKRFPLLPPPGQIADPPTILHIRASPELSTASLVLRSEVSLTQKHGPSIAVPSMVPLTVPI